MTTIPTSPHDPINRAILEVSEDRVRGFVRNPIGEIARLAGFDTVTVIEQISAMLRAGTVRRVRQTLQATNLAQGALVAWLIDDAKLDAAFDWFNKNDPFSGHVVIRNSEDGDTRWRLWTTLKVPAGFSIEAHCDYVRETIGADRYRIMPALRAFVLGVGHMRRKNMKAGEKSEQLAEARQPVVVELTDLDWRVLTALKREFRPEELSEMLWSARAAEAKVPLDVFFRVAEELDRKGVIGRFSTFLEHSKPVAGNESLSSFNGLFHWAVPPGREIEAGREIGRFAILTHAYWRDAGRELHDVNIMAVAHGDTKEQVLAHKKAIDDHLWALGIGFTYTNVFWGGRAEIKPSEVSPAMYREWSANRIWSERTPAVGILPTG
jgi:DNA-binding Lrp family transcriptional regulator